MPLTAFQSQLGRLLAANRTEDSYLAGAAAFLAVPNTHRFSHDLDYFHDSAGVLPRIIGGGSESDGPEPELRKWWNWKDRSL